jgi:ABC-type nitrate/sulfonate/bicarbonate transport system permease component
VQLAVLAAFLAVWQLAASWRIIDPFITSQPSAIAEKVLELANDGSLGYHIAVTVIETLIGFGIGTLLGIAMRHCLALFFHADYSAAWLRTPASRLTTSSVVITSANIASMIPSVALCS